MIKQTLVVQTGFPGAGKSEMARALEELDFWTVSTDRVREEIYGVTDFYSFKRTPEFEEIQTNVFNIISSQIVTLLGYGYSVVVDSTAPDYASREELFALPQKAWLGGLDNILLYVKADEAVLRQRNLAKGRTNDVVGEWQTRWEEPRPGEGYELVTVENNTPEQLERNIAQLYERFQRIEQLRAV